MKKLIVLAADKSMKVCVEAVLGRPHSLGIHPLSNTDFDVFVQPNYDSSVFLSGHEFLRSQAHRYQYAVAMCDRIGCGRESASRESLEQEMELKLAQSGWANRSTAVVIDPELEVWMWADSPHVDDIIGWRGRRPPVREWLRVNGYLPPGQVKPNQPQKCLDRVLELSLKPRSSALFQAIAEKVSLSRCADPAFRKFADTLRRWFPGDSPE